MGIIALPCFSRQVVVFVIIVNGFPAVRFVVDAIRGTRSDRELGSSVGQLVAVLVGAYQPLGELVLLSVYTYMIAILFLPPKSNRQASPGFLKGVRCGGCSKPVLFRLCCCTCQLTFRLTHMWCRRKRVAKAVGLEQPLFSLETACWLFDLAWEAYYDPPGHTTASCTHYG